LRRGEHLVWRLGSLLLVFVKVFFVSLYVSPETYTHLGGGLSKFFSGLVEDAHSATPLHITHDDGVCQLEKPNP